MDQYHYKINTNMFNLISNIRNCNFFVLSVKERRSAQKFLGICKTNNSKLLSVDVVDYSYLYNEK